MSAVDYLQALQDCCRDDEAFARLRELLIHLPSSDESLRDSEQKFAIAFRCSPSAIALTTLPEGRLFEVNDRFCEIVGYSREEVIGYTVSELGIWANLDDRVKIIQLLQKQGFVRNSELDFLRKSGEKIVALFSAEVIYIQDQPCVLSVTHDITEIAQLYQQIQRLNAGLERQVAQRTAELQQKMHELQELSQLKEDFLHAVSHDLRTPMMGLAIVTQNLLKHGSNKSEIIPVARSILHRISHSCDRQLDLIHSLLEAHSSDRKGIVLHYESLQLDAFLKTVIEDLEPLILENQATLAYQSEPTLPFVTVDRIQLQRVFENLITNALQHNPPGLALTLRATVNADLVYCEIQDNGIGMKPEDCEHLFDRYARGPRARRSAGIGLGLYLCRQIITAHGGQIGAISHLGKGARFWFTLPIGGDG